MAMTNKGAIETLQANVIFACEKAGLSNAAIRMTEDALDMAIAALEKEVWKEDNIRRDEEVYLSRRFV